MLYLDRRVCYPNTNRGVNHLVLSYTLLDNKLDIVVAVSRRNYGGEKGDCACVIISYMLIMTSLLAICLKKLIVLPITTRRRSQQLSRDLVWRPFIALFQSFCVISNGLLLMQEKPCIRGSACIANVLST